LSPRGSALAKQALAGVLVDRGGGAVKETLGAGTGAGGHQAAEPFDIGNDVLVEVTAHALAVGKM